MINISLYIYINIDHNNYNIKYSLVFFSTRSPLRLKTEQYKRKKRYQRKMKERMKEKKKVEVGTKEFTDGILIL